MKIIFYIFIVLLEHKITNHFLMTFLYLNKYKMFDMLPHIKNSKTLTIFPKSIIHKSIVI